MSVVIVGGHDRMVCQYKKICKQFKCKAKVFTHMSADLNKQLGQPDLFVLFTNTVSHKMVKTALDEAKRSNAKVVRSHTSSGAALTEILTQEAGAATTSTTECCFRNRVDRMIRMLKTRDPFWISLEC